MRKAYETNSYRIHWRDENAPPIAWEINRLINPNADAKLERSFSQDLKSILSIQNTSSTKGVAILGLEFQTKTYSDVKRLSYDCGCEVILVKNIDGIVKETFTIPVNKNVVCDENAVMSLESPQGEHCILEPRASVKVGLMYSSVHPVHRIHSKSLHDVFKNVNRSNNDISVTYNGESFHVLSIFYKMAYPQES